MCCTYLHTYTHTPVDKHEYVHICTYIDTTQCELMPTDVKPPVGPSHLSLFYQAVAGRLKDSYSGLWTPFDGIWSILRRPVENFELSWLTYLVLVKNVELDIPLCLETGGILKAEYQGSRRSLAL